MTSVDDFRTELDRLKVKYASNSEAVELIVLLIPTLGHYEKFAMCFVELMSDEVETSMMFGLLSLVIKVH